MNLPALDEMREISASIKPLTTLLAPEMDAVNQVILKRMESHVPLIPQLAGHLIAAGGKRLRPLLTLAGAYAGLEEKTGDAAGGLPHEAQILSAAVEFIHNATLLHDDVIDKSDKRRGRETANAVWGNEASVLVGDFLFARAFELMVETGDIKILELLASASAQITEGEVKQMTMQNEPASSIEDYMDVITSKTAILFAAAAEAGVRCSGGGSALTQAMHQYGLSLGRAFQICDDALDYVSKADEMGKNAGDDFFEGKITLPLIIAYQDGSADERSFFDRTIGQSDYGDADFEQACMILNRHDAISRALDYADKEVEQAIAKLEALPQGALRSALHEAALFSARRSV